MKADQVEQLGRTVVALARSRGRADLAASVDAELAREGTGTAKIVVVGEANRGKSSLVNALIGADELSPVASDVATSCHIVIRAGAARRVVVHLRDGGSEEVAPDALPDYATETGSRSKLTKAVEITLDSPLLHRGITLIDTPGVGGLTAGHAEITRAALVEADALLFVLDAESEIGSAEVRFLEQVTERVGTVLFAFGKIDDYPAWRTLLDSSRARLPERFRELPVIGVSSDLRQKARRAEARGDAERAQTLLERSGFGKLEAELERSVVSRARQLRLWNVLAASRTALDELERPDLVVSVATDPALPQRVKEANAELQRVKDATTIVAQEVSLDLEGLRLRITEEYDRRTVELERRYRQRIQEWDDDFAETMPEALQEDLDALAGALHAILLEGIADIDRSLVERFGVTETGVALEQGDQRIPLPELLPSQPRQAQSTKMRRTQLLMMGGLGGGRMAMFGGQAAAGIVTTAAVGTLTAGLAVAGAVVGLSVAAYANRRIDKSQGKEVAKQQATLLVADAIKEARIQLQTPLSNRILALRREFQADVDRRLKARQDALGEEASVARDLNSKALGERQQAEKAANDRLAPVRALKQELGALWDDLGDEALA